MLVVGIERNDDSFQVLSTIARVSGATYDALPDLVKGWRKFKGGFSRLNEPLSSAEELAMAQNYLSPMLRCAKPDSIDLRRWFIKCLSNDQTAFTGFTSLVDVVESDTFGYDGAIRILPSASFVEPFAVDKASNFVKERLFEIKDQLDQLDSTKIGQIDSLLNEAQAICPISEKRGKGKSPLFFYGVSDKPFQLSAPLYGRLVKTAKAAYSALCRATGEEGRVAFTGSVDMMLFGNDIYVIDIGSPAVGYVADILCASKALGRQPDVGIEKIVSTFNDTLRIPQSLVSQELGFFKLEREYLISQLRKMGVIVEQTNGPFDTSYEVIINGKGFPTPTFDYLSRNQILRNRILENDEQLSSYGARIPSSRVLIPDDFSLARFYEQSQLGDRDYGLLVKKKVFFKEYETGSSYFKPLIVPVFGREMRIDSQKSNLFEQFVPSLLDIDVLGDKKGKRCYEIRMYFVGGEIR